MPLRAAPGESSGPRRVQRTQRNAEPVLQTPVARPTGRLPSLQTHSPPEPSQPKALAPGGPSGISASDSTAAAGAYGDGMTGGEDEPEPDGLEEQTEAHALLANAANHPDWRVASQALDGLMCRLLVLHRLLEVEERLAPPGASKR